MQKKSLDFFLHIFCRWRNEVTEMQATERTTMTMEDRKILSEMWAAGEKATAIATRLGVCPASGYKGQRRGESGRLNVRSRPEDDPARGQAEYQRRLRNRGRRRRIKEERNGTAETR